ncbi:hypothetical protein LTR36_002899 [Oleoguttula mirabilis]|uniref:Uncharacterized protein n=1 Tax=Oleoguttula mirabilis TaxID=1507867 RepID=A0AAV9JJG0_9PEZI|nr:hypothetical protein LTR36_002899 [Oleoguttula mirabilis]
MARPQDTKEATSHLQLPGELRNRIYRLVAVNDALTQATIKPSRKTGRVKYKALVPGLAATCRSIRDEPLPIYYAENIFMFEPRPTCIHRPSHSDIKARFDSLGANASRVTSVGTRFPMRNGNVETIIARLKGPDVVRFEVGEGLQQLCACLLKHVEKELDQTGVKSATRLALAAYFCSDTLYEQCRSLQRAGSPQQVTDGSLFPLCGVCGGRK